jgi:hypothetical protein
MAYKKNWWNLTSIYGKKKKTRTEEDLPNLKDSIYQNSYKNHCSL